MCIPRMLWVGKVGLKDGLEQPSSATGPSPLGSMGPRAGQVKTRTNYQSWSVCSVPWHKVHPYHMPAKQDTNPTTMVKLSLLRPMIKQSPPRHYHLPGHHLLVPGAAPISSYGASPKGTKGGPSGTGSIAGPHITCSPTSSIWTSLGGTPNSRASPDARSCPAPEALLLLDHHLLWHSVFTTAQAA